MKRLALALAAFALTTCSAPSDQPDNLSAFQAITSHQNAQEVTVEGTAAQVLPDTTGPAGRHERFVIDVHAGNGDEQLILVAHNIDIAPRVPIQSGDDVVVRGELALDRSGPVIHFTHHDPRGRHIPGFIKVHGQTYE